MNDRAPGWHAPRFATIAALTLIMLVTLGVLVVCALDFDGVAGVYGWNTGPDGVTVTQVTPGYPAALAGIRPGDVVDYASLLLAGRVNTDVPQAAQGR